MVINSSLSVLFAILGRSSHDAVVLHVLYVSSPWRSVSK